MAVKNESELSMEEIQKQVADILNQAKEEARKIVEEAKEAAGTKEAMTPEKDAAGTKEAMTPEKKAAHEAYMNELVEVKLFKDSGKYKDDVFVGVNGETIAIQRGVRVKIKRKFAEVLDNSEHQDYETAELITRKVKEGEKSAKAAGV